MDRTSIEKNRLDLAYQRRMQHENVILVFMTTGLFSFVVSMLFGREQRTTGIIIAVSLLVISILVYKKIDRELQSISRQISDLNNKPNEKSFK